MEGWPAVDGLLSCFNVKIAERISEFDLIDSVLLKVYTKMRSFILIKTQVGIMVSFEWVI